MTAGAHRPGWPSLLLSLGLAFDVCLSDSDRLQFHFGLLPVFLFCSFRATSGFPDEVGSFCDPIVSDWLNLVGRLCWCWCGCGHINFRYTTGTQYLSRDAIANGKRSVHRGQPGQVGG
jgi:hypothetical protein